MRIAQRLFFIIGIIFIAFNVLGYLGGHNPILQRPNASFSSKVAYFIGSNLFLVAGFICLAVSAYFKRKLKRRNNSVLVDSLFENDNS